MLPRDQGEGGDAEDHRAVRPHWETAGQRVGGEDPRQLGDVGWASVFPSALGGYRLEL